jgi:hypothetical protein
MYPSSILSNTVNFELMDVHDMILDDITGK